MAWSAPTTSVLDAFNRANGALGSAWSNLSGGSAAAITSNQVQCNTGSNYSEQWWNGTTFTGEGEIYLTLPAVSTTTGQQVYVDMFTGWSTSSTAGLNGYQMTVTRGATNDTLQIDRYTGGSIAGGNIKPAVAISGHVAAGDMVALTREAGGVLKMWRKPAAGAWAQVSTSVTDTTYFNAGQTFSVGFGSFGTAWRIDDFGGGTITGGTTPVTVTPSTPAVAFTATASAQAATSVTPAAATASFAATAAATAATAVTPSAANAVFSAAATVATSATVDLGTVTAAALFTATGAATAALGVTPSVSSVSFTATGAATAVSNVAGASNVVFSTAAAALAPTSVAPGSANTVFGAGAVVTTPGTPTASSRLPLIGVGT